MTASSTPLGPNDPPPPKPVISPPNTVHIVNIVTGCKVFVERPNEPEPRKAEILSIRTKKLTRAARRATSSMMEVTMPEVVETPSNGEAVVAGVVGGETNLTSSATPGTPSTSAASAAKDEEKLEYYVHYVEFNKRLDEWVPGTRILLSREVEWPIITPVVPTPVTGTSSARKQSANTSASSTPAREATPPPMKKAAEAGSLLRKAALKAAASASAANKRKAVDSAKAHGGKENVKPESSVTEDDEDEDESQDGEKTADGSVSGDPDADGDEEMADGEEEEKETPTFSKAREIEKLRTSGSMTQSHSEVSRVKNLDKIQMGKHEVEAWYFSPYPIEYAHTPTLYICEFCLSFFHSEKMIERHRKKCTLHHPPGNEIYRHEEISFFEIDGRKQKTWCRNLCLLSKCFLDHKTLYYDVDPFLYYVMCFRDDTGVHTIGYFSKEKECAEAYNVACILTLPQYQRMGYGKLLIEFSYELSKKEQKLGSPEKPLSDLGLLSYRAYWAETIVELLLTTRDDISIDEIAQKTAIVHADVMHTCQVLQMLKFSKGSHHLVVSEAVIEQYERAKKKGRRKIDPSKLIWKPPVFSRSELRFLGF